MEPFHFEWSVWRYLVTHFLRLEEIPVGRSPRRHYSGLVVVERVDHGDEAARLGLSLQVHDGNVSDEDGVKDLKKYSVAIISFHVKF